MTATYDAVPAESSGQSEVGRRSPGNPQDGVARDIVADEAGMMVGRLGARVREQGVAVTRAPSRGKLGVQPVGRVVTTDSWRTGQPVHEIASSYRTAISRLPRTSDGK